MPVAPETIGNSGILRLLAQCIQSRAAPANIEYNILASFDSESPGNVNQVIHTLDTLDASNVKHAKWPIGESRFRD